MKENENWYSRGKEEAQKGIPPGDRIVGVGIVLFSSLMLGYLLTHQIRSTGFYTESFRTIEMFLLYGFWIGWIITSSLEGLFGQRFLSRLFDVFGGIIFLAFSTLWLLVVFPFQFEYFPDILPESYQFLLEWITNDIARITMGVVFLVLVGAAIFSPIAYKFVVISKSR